MSWSQPPMFLDYLAVLLKGPEAADKRYVFNVAFTDIGERYLLEVENGVLNYAADEASASPDATLTMTRGGLDAIVLGETTLADLTDSGSASIDGDAAAFEDFVGMLDSFELWFNIVTP